MANISRERCSPLSTPSATRDVLERHGLYTKYGLGQNFLVNDDVISRILELSDVNPTDCVLEVGPGIGTLTAALLQRAARVIAIEKDRDLLPVLADTLAPWQEKLSVISGDARAICRDSDGVRDASGEVFPSGSIPNKLVSNLPYSVAATVVLDFLQNCKTLESATIMVQKEVADRMMAKPGTKAYGAYTVKLSLFAKPVGRFPVAPGNFFPPPHVESAVLRLNRNQVCDDELARMACRMADAAFANRRKTLANSCKAYFANSPEIQQVLPDVFAAADIDPRRRGETLVQAEFLALARAATNLAESPVS